MKTKLVIIGVVLMTLSVIFKEDIGGLFASASNTEIQVNAQTGKNGKAKKSKAAPAAVTIVKKWNLPEVLNEVSGIAFIDENRFACVQDEEGTIFIYNTATEKIESKIPFAGAGDYEGITLAGNTAYVVRSDGMLYEVANYTSAQPKMATYKTPLTEAHNIEGLAFDKRGNRLLLAVKDEDPVSNDHKGVYPFDLGTKKLASQPIFSIATNDALLGGGKKKKAVRPSAIGIQPDTGNYYILDGPKSRLLQLDGAGKLVAVKELGNDFAKPEGITFDPTGRIFISNERGKNSPANIVEIKEN